MRRRRRSSLLLRIPKGGLRDERRQSSTGMWRMSCSQDREHRRRKRSSPGSCAPAHPAAAKPDLAVEVAALPCGAGASRRAWDNNRRQTHGSAVGQREASQSDLDGGHHAATADLLVFEKIWSHRHIELEIHACRRSRAFRGSSCADLRRRRAYAILRVTTDDNVS
jgi:hypothetical protein